MITVAIGDVHGCLDQLKMLMDIIERKYSQDVKKYVFVGDYIDRGPDSKGVVDYIIHLSKVREVVTLLGNHEDMMMQNMAGWYQNGGYATNVSYGDTWPMETSHKDFYDNLKLYHDDGKRFFCHAGVACEPLEANDKMTLIWIRNPFLQSKKKWSRLIVHGHTPSFKADIYPNRINLDQACVFGGRLLAAIFDEKKVEPIDYLSVDGLDRRPGPL